MYQVPVSVNRAKTEPWKIRTIVGYEYNLVMTEGDQVKCTPCSLNFRSSRVKLRVAVPSNVGVGWRCHILLTPYLQGTNSVPFLRGQLTEEAIERQAPSPTLVYYTVENTNNS